MVKIDLKNDIVEFSHDEAFEAVCLLLSYISTQNSYKKLDSEEFLKSFRESYESYLVQEQPIQKFKKIFETIAPENKVNEIKESKNMKEMREELEKLHKEKR